METDKLTIKEAKQKMDEFKAGYEKLQGIFNDPNNLDGNDCGGESPFKIGENYFIRTVTWTLVGKLKALYKNELVLSDASWIADVGRFNEALANSLEKISDSEIEPFQDDCIIGRLSIVDCSIYRHKLPTEAK